MYIVLLIILHSTFELGNKIVKPLLKTEKICFINKYKKMSTKATHSIKRDKIF